MEGRLLWGCFAGRVRLVYVYVWHFQKDVPCRAPYFGNKIVTWTHGLGPSTMWVQQERSATELKTQCVLCKLCQTNNLALPSDRAGQVTGSSAHHPVASLLDSGWSCCVVNVALLLSCRQAKNRGRFRIRIPKKVLPLASEAIQKFRPLWHRLWDPFGSPKPWNFVAMWDLAMFDWSGLQTTLSANDPNPDRNRFKCDSVRGFVSWFIIRDPIWLYSHKCFLGEAWWWNCTNTFLKVAPIWLYTPASRRSVV